MEISGVKMDLKEIMSRVRSSILEDFAGMPWKYESEGRIEQLNLVIRGMVWHEMTERLKASTGNNDGNVRAEEAMAEAMRRGLKQENIRFRRKAFFACLPNTLFRVRKRESGYAAGPESVGGYGSEEMGWCSPAMFADLMFTFDSLIPQIDSEAAPILEKLLEMRMNLEREKMAEMVQKTAIKALIEKYLSPLGINAAATVDGDRVILNMEMFKRGCLETTLEELPGLLEDTEAVMEELKPVKERKLFFHR